MKNLLEQFINDKQFDHLRLKDSREIIQVNLVPRNEAEYPEKIWVDIKNVLSVDDGYTLIAQLLVQPSQDFGMKKGELVVVKIQEIKDDLIAFCQNTLKELQV